MDIKENRVIVNVNKPKSNIHTYTKFPPKKTDTTRIGHWLRQYMLLDDITEDERFHSNNIIDIIFECY